MSTSSVEHPDRVIVSSVITLTVFSVSPHISRGIAEVKIYKPILCIDCSVHSHKPTVYVPLVSAQSPANDEQILRIPFPSAKSNTDVACSITECMVKYHCCVYHCPVQSSTNAAYTIAQCSLVRMLRIPLPSAV